MCSCQLNKGINVNIKNIIAKDTMFGHNCSTCDYTHSSLILVRFSMLTMS